MGKHSKPEPLTKATGKPQPGDSDKLTEPAPGHEPKPEQAK